jgi:Uncharacterized protein conserved in bacteria (DUF2252)
MDFPKLTGSVGGQIRITDKPPLIFHPEVTRAPEARATLDQIFKAYRETLADDRRMLLDRYRLVDAAIKVVGGGSVGRRCWNCIADGGDQQSSFSSIQGSSPVRT